MGCQSSNSKGTQSKTSVSIVDKKFMRPENESIRTKMNEHNISHECFISMDCFIEEFSSRYVKDVITNPENFKSLKTELEKLRLDCNIYVVRSEVAEPNAVKVQVENGTTYINTYEDLLEHFIEKKCKEEVNEDEPGQVEDSKTRIDVKFIKQKKSKAGDDLIMQSTLKAKNIQYEVYDNYKQFEKSFEETSCHFIVADYIFHHEAINFSQKRKCKVICYCTLDKHEAYSPYLHMFSNNMLEIASSISSDKKFAKMVNIKCSRVFMYAPAKNYITKFIHTIENFNFTVRPFSDKEKFLSQTKLYFCTTLLVDQEDRKHMEKFLDSNDYLFKTKIISIPSEIESTPQALKKVIRELKKGYYSEKKLTDSLDIIDRNCGNGNDKYKKLKQELDSHGIKYFSYENATKYIKNKKFICPFVICSLDERSLLTRYLTESKSKAKVIIFCNKSKTNSEIKNKNYTFISSQANKIMKFILKNKVNLPYILDENSEKIQEKKNKVKDKNSRFSALKWSGLLPSNASKETTNFQFMNVAADTHASDIKDIIHSASNFWKLDNNPLKNLKEFKKDFVNSIRELVKIYKIESNPTDLVQLLKKTVSMTLMELSKHCLQFFKSESIIGLKINESLINIESLKKEEIMYLREYIFLINLNYLSLQKFPHTGQIKLEYWCHEDLVEKCEVGSTLLSKNYMICYENTSMESLGTHKIVTTIECSPATDTGYLINTFFQYEKKYIFAPYTQFTIQSISKNELGVTIIDLKCRKSNEYLYNFYLDNFMKPNAFITYFDSEVQKEKSEIISSEKKSCIEANVLRCKSLEASRVNVPEAIVHQKALIKLEEQKEDFDSRRINEYNFDLICIMTKQDDDRDKETIEKLITELLDSDPDPYIALTCENLLRVIKGEEPLQNTSNKIKSKRITDLAQNTFKQLKDIEDLQGDQSDVSSMSDCDEDDDLRSDENMEIERDFDFNIMDDTDEKENFVV